MKPSFSIFPSDLCASYAFKKNIMKLIEMSCISINQNMEVKIYKMMDGCITKNKAKTDNNIELPDGIVVVLCCFKRIGYSR